MKTKQGIVDFDLPTASKKIAKELLNKGATFTRLKGTAIYSINFKGNSYEFYGDFTPSIPYMWGIVLSRRHFWTEILKGSKIKVVVNSYSNHDKIRVFITNNHFYNALLEKKVYLKVDGVTKLNDLIKQENIKRINSNDPLQIPLKIYSKRVDLKRIVKNGKMVLIEGNYDYENITDSISPQIIETAKKVMNSFPRLGYICLELVTEDVRKHRPTYAVSNLFISPGINIFSGLIKNKNLREASDIIIENMLSYNKPFNICNKYQ